MRVRLELHEINDLDNSIQTTRKWDVFVVKSKNQQDIQILYVHM
jgi:hypothetical protein